MKRTFLWPPKDEPAGLKWFWTIYGKHDGKSRRLRWTVEPPPARGVFSMPLVFRHLRKGERFQPALANMEIYPLIGAVALYWGNFEVRMNELLAAFVAADADPHDRGWDRKNFTKRSELLKSKVKARFPGRISEEVNAILAAAAVYHWQRNLMVHGHLQAHFENGVPVAVATGRLNKRIVSLPLEPEFIERMYHELAMLTGRISDLTAPDSQEICRLAWRCRSRLRAFAEKHPVTPPKPHKIRPRHPPLQKLSRPRRKGDAAVVAPLRKGGR